VKRNKHHVCTQRRERRGGKYLCISDTLTFRVCVCGRRIGDFCTRDSEWGGLTAAYQCQTIFRIPDTAYIYCAYIISNPLPFSFYSPESAFSMLNLHIYNISCVTQVHNTHADTCLDPCQLSACRNTLKLSHPSPFPRVKAKYYGNA
jgi:hypothetical protein